MTDNLAYTEIRKPDIHTGARVFGVVDLCVDSGVDDDESAAARTRLKRGAQHGEQRAFGAGNALRVVVELGCGMGEQLVIKGVRRFLRQRDGMGGKHARLLFDACHCAGMMGIECVTEVALPDGEHAEQAGEDEHRSKQDEDHRSPICDKLAPHGDFLARRMHKLGHLPYAVHARLPPFANRESGFNLWESDLPTSRC